jgi:3-hydroxyacyl-[acyl-carrier-protein] dehydratase
VADKNLILDFSEYDVEKPIADLAEIRRVNPQRHEMEQITAIVYEDRDRQVCVGYKDYGPNEFWVRGHMPERPIVPGVLMCEAAAQLASYYTVKHDLLGTNMIGFGGLDEVRFRDVVFVGDRLVIVTELLKVRRGAMTVCRFQGFVRQAMVCEGQIKGVPLPPDRILRQGLSTR